MSYIYVAWYKLRTFFSLTLIPNLGGGYFTPSPCLFTPSNLEVVKAVTLKFCSIQLHLIRDILTKFGISNLPQSPDIGQNLDGGVSDFRISGQSPKKVNFHNSRTSDDIDMNLGPVTKLDKGNKNTPKNWRWLHVGKLRRHCHFPNLRPIWSNPETGFQTRSL